jgi:hypothetical protein
MCLLYFLLIFMTVMITALNDKKMAPFSKDWKVSRSCSWKAGVEFR